MSRREANQLLREMHEKWVAPRLEKGKIVIRVLSEHGTTQEERESFKRRADELDRDMKELARWPQEGIDEFLGRRLRRLQNNYSVPEGYWLDSWMDYLETAPDMLTHRLRWLTFRSLVKQANHR